MRNIVLILSFQLIMINLLFSSTISLEKIEPMFWWTKMKNPNLQLMVYGKNIAETKAYIDYAGVEIKKQSQVENPNYLFVDLIISKNAKAGKFYISFKKGKKVIEKFEYELKARKDDSQNRDGFNSSDAIYLLMPDRFSNGNPANDNVNGMLEKSNRTKPLGRHGGDIQGIENHLDYLEELGITALWLNPLLENNMPVESYHGYAITDFYKTDTRFGTNEDYLRLVEKCHSHGIKVIIDLIFNHCGSKHWWMNDLPMQNWIHQFPEFTRSNYRAGTIVDPYASDFDKNKMQTGWFDKTMPDLNQNNEFLSNYLIQNSIWWIEYANLDGVRMDTYPYPYKNMMTKWAKRVMAEYPNFNIVGEAWLGKPSLVSYWQKDALNFDGFNSHLPSVFDFPLMYKLSSAFNENDGWDTGLSSLYDILGEDFLYPNPDNLVTFLDNHDGDRFFNKINGIFNSYKMATAFLLTIRGIPQIYYGTEILMDGKEHVSHGDIRKDFQGGWENDKENAFLQSGRSKKQDEAFNYMSKLLNWRKNNEVIHTGNLKHFIPENGIYVYFRYNSENAVMVILNNNDKSKTIDTKRFNECLANYNSGSEIITDKELLDISTISIGKKSAMIIELKK